MENLGLIFLFLISVSRSNVNNRFLQVIEPFKLRDTNCKYSHNKNFYLFSLCQMKFYES